MNSESRFLRSLKNVNTAAKRIGEVWNYFQKNLSYCTANGGIFTDKIGKELTPIMEAMDHWGKQYVKEYHKIKMMNNFLSHILPKVCFILKVPSSQTRIIS